MESLKPPPFPCTGLDALKKMLPTPSTSHVNYEYIYEPAEDSFLLLDTLSSNTETSFLQSRFPASASRPPLVLEVGCGSGVVLAFINAHAQHILGRTDALTLGIDINAFACQASIATVKQAASAVARGADSTPPAQPAQFLDCVNGDLTTLLRPQSVDVLIFNPPYVPTEALPHYTDAEGLDEFAPEELFGRNSHLLALSYAGGIDGMETTNRLLDDLPFVLSRNGVAYLLLCRQNHPEQVMDRIRAWPGAWDAETIRLSGKQAGWEKLSIIRIWRP